MQAARDADASTLSNRQQRHNENARLSDQLAATTVPADARALILRHGTHLDPKVLASKWPLVVADIAPNRDLVRVQINPMFRFRVRELARTPAWYVGSLGRGSTTPGMGGDIHTTEDCVATNNGEVWKATGSLVPTDTKMVSVARGGSLSTRSSGSNHHLDNGRTMVSTWDLGGDGVVSAVQFITPKNAPERLAAQGEG
jgi:hypothetical protein